jgi:hypothetical protein
MKLVLTTALILGASLHGRASAQAGDPLLKDPEKKTERFDPAKVTYLTAWPKPQSKDQLVTDIERMVKATIPEMAEGGKQGVLAEGTAAVPFVLERYGKEKDEDVLQRLKTVLIEISKPEQTRLLAQDFDHRDVRHRTFALWRCAAFPDPSIKALSEAAWAKVQKQGEKADADERYAAALVRDLVGFDAGLRRHVRVRPEGLGQARRRAARRAGRRARRGGEQGPAGQAGRRPQGAHRRAEDAGRCGDKSVVGTLKPLLDDPDNESAW